MLKYEYQIELREKMSNFTKRIIKALCIAGCYLLWELLELLQVEAFWNVMITNIVAWAIGYYIYRQPWLEPIKDEKETIVHKCLPYVIVFLIEIWFLWVIF